MIDSVIDTVMVVIPARNEERLLGRCLDAVRRAERDLARTRPWIEVLTVVVLDGCTDRSAAIAAGRGVHAVRIDVGRVGAVRRRGVLAGMERLRTTGEVEPEGVWVACTDADTQVSPDWLTVQIAAAEQGHALVLGAVRPAAGELTRAEQAAWERRHRHGAHIHGANLGIALSTYLAVGGFEDVTEHEDVSLARRALDLGVSSTSGATVVTSARLNGRTPGGFAGYLRALRRELATDSSLEPAVDPT